MIRNKIVGSMLGGALALGLLGGGMVAFAQTDEATPAAPSTQTDEAAPLTGSGRASDLIDSDQALADALGIDLATLTAARDEARIALIDQAVADGHLTAEEGQALKDDGSRLRGRSQYGYDKGEFLADALGITVDALNAAQLEVYEAELAARVAAGHLTQEEAGLMLARKVAEQYLDTDSINAQVRSAQEAAIAAAVADGAITQAQADALLAYLDASPYNFSGFNGRGHGGHGGHGAGRGSRGFGLETLPDITPPDTTTDTALDA